MCRLIGATIRYQRDFLKNLILVMAFPLQNSMAAPWASA
ncbi:hypothetical protein ATPR_1029 [Acetobacter tropicalis NBRC 101654]|uniref:Uncharacterized protein n=1 Tax=Acetobacter tropicalis NBRC 101654 TaxID=749388 RepID=F7VCD0_9PROT|nr:hypothetical protein ATPR_1029 [Acetobacter tropicalis NBRC 101654]